MIAIVAINKRGVIGHDGGIPWPKNEEDMRHFVEVTRGARVIFSGRKTWETLPERAQQRLVKDREVNIIASTREGYDRALGCYYASPQLAEDMGWTRLHLNGPRHKVVIGGAQTYALFAPAITQWLVTELDNDAEDDVTMTRHWEDKSAFGLYEERAIEGGVIRTYRRWM